MVGMEINDTPWVPLPLVLLDAQLDDDFPLVWDCRKSTVDIKKYKLFWESLLNTKEELKLKDLEIRRKDVELKRKEEEKKQLAQLLKLTTEERDVARGGIRLLLNKTSSDDLYSVVGAAALVKSGGSSSTTESNSLTFNNQHYGYELDTITSPYLTNANMVMGTLLESSSVLAEPDRASLIIDALAKQKPLPEKGKLLQAVHAVTRTTPMLETLLMTGTLPEWQIPPPPLPSADLCELRRVVFRSQVSNYRAMGAKRQMIQN